MRFFCFIVAISLLLQANIFKNIYKNKKILNIKKKKAKIIKDRLEDIASNILTKKREISKIDEKIKETNDFLNKQQIIYADKIKELSQLQENIASLTKTKKIMQKKLIDLISKKLIIQIVNNQNNNANAIVNNEIIKNLSKILDDSFGNIKLKYSNIVKQIDTVNNKIKSLKLYIKQIQNKKILLANMKKDKEKDIQYFKKVKLNYDKKLNRIFQEQKEIKKTLTKLKILQRNIQKQRAKQTIKINPKLLPNINSQKVRKIGSSYQRDKVINYRGPKTIAPLKNFYIKRKFGTYYDPVYKIKIFNQSVVLGSRIPNAKVYNVLNGKVIFAKYNSMLDNVIIVENSRGIYTIYAHLSKIAPTIRKGKRIRKGYIIGRIKNALTFEVTQRKYHINPLKLIRF